MDNGIPISQLLHILDPDPVLLQPFDIELYEFEPFLEVLFLYAPVPAGLF